MYDGEQEINMIGWRARLGLLVPSGNTTIEPELYRLAPRGVSLHFARLKLGRDTADEIERMSDDLEQQAERLGDGNVDLICFGCTGGSLLGGVGYDKDIIKRIEDSTGIPATTTSTAVVEALKRLKGKKLSVATPYPEWLNEKLRSFLEGHDFIVVAMEGLGLETGMENVPQESVYRLARRVNRPDSDIVFISCTDFPTLEVIGSLEKDLGKTVISSNLATMWMLLRLVRLPDTLEGYGRLMGIT
jgi:maleate isomerase